MQQNVVDIIKDVVCLLNDEYKENRKKLCLTIITFILLSLYYLPFDDFTHSALRLFYWFYFLHHIGCYAGRWIYINSAERGKEKSHAVKLSIVFIYSLYFLPNAAYYFINVIIFIAYAIIHKPSQIYIKPDGNNKFRRILSLYGF